MQIFTTLIRDSCLAELKGAKTFWDRTGQLTINGSLWLLPLQSGHPRGIRPSSAEPFAGAEPAENDAVLPTTQTSSKRFSSTRSICRE